ncbi:hypothetical protein HDU98_011165 [Podochytrium sp. JEL0797]|nr:hypothetical protein HDU98_011165 [Podochytrium sp. JEL0797]
MHLTPIIPPAIQLFEILLVCLPNEILVLVLSWVDPRIVLKFRHRNLPLLLSSYPRNLLQYWFVWPKTFQDQLTDRMYDPQKTTAIEIAWISGRFEVGSIPQRIGSLSKLKSLVLRQMDLDGETPLASLGRVPSELGGLRNLEHLNLSSNMLVGEFPESLLGLVGLKTLNLLQNRFVGLIPDAIGELEKLEQLILSDNLLSAPPIIPTSSNLSSACDRCTGPPPLGTKLDVKTKRYKNLSSQLLLEYSTDAWPSNRCDSTVAAVIVAAASSSVLWGRSEINVTLLCVAQGQLPPTAEYIQCYAKSK